MGNLYADRRTVRLRGGVFLIDNFHAIWSPCAWNNQLKSPRSVNLEHWEGGRRAGKEWCPLAWLADNVSPRGEGERMGDHKARSRDYELCLRPLYDLKQDGCHLCVLLPWGKEVGWLLSFAVPWGRLSAPGILAVASLLFHARTGKRRNQVADVPGEPGSLWTPLSFIPK